MILLYRWSRIWFIMRSPRHVHPGVAFLAVMLLLWIPRHIDAQDTLRIMHYNLLYFGYNTSSCNSSNNNVYEKADHLKTIVGHVRPDIFTVNEISKIQTYHDLILETALNVNGTTSYKKGNPSNQAGSTIINQVFYNSDKLVLKSSLSIITNVRDVDIFRFYYHSGGQVQGDTVYLHCVVAHLKAGSGGDDEAERADETFRVMSYLNDIGASGNWCFMGDLNVYRSSEQAFQNLIAHPNSSIRFYDPVNKIGYWNGNSTFAAVHTQSTHTSGECPSTGGMDDRFDFILVSDEILLGSAGIQYVMESYHALGQDGLHYNKSLLDPPVNNSVPTDVLDALYDMSDHLPVVTALRIDLGSGLHDIRNPLAGIRVTNPFSGDLELWIPDLPDATI
ncbi:MAG: hypothetical protein JW861_08155, partial [Bacteroidales bacterium]|nr:hypothetical protein [Bacteroidales bacterium]